MKLHSELTANFGRRAQEMSLSRGSLCVGIDPHPQLLRDWNLPCNGAGAWDFSMIVLDALGDKCGFFKPQSALYEEYGSSGISALSATLRAIDDCGALSILDVKRGDIGSTMEGYARAYLADGPLAADAITLNPYLGFESLRPALDMAQQNQRGVFVLTLTSNPEAAALQAAMMIDPESGQEISVAGDIIRRVGLENHSMAAADSWGHVGMVIGATVGQRIAGLQAALEQSNAPLLVPGFGAQGGTTQQVKAVFGSSLDRIIVSSSRGILRTGPKTADLQNAFESNLNSVKSMISD